MPERKAERDNLSAILTGGSVRDQKQRAIEPYLYLGQWYAERRVRHRHRGQMMFFKGTAEITRNTFKESGELRIGNSRIESVRSYTLNTRDEGVEVLFPDMRSFIWMSAKAVQRIYHHCGEDEYRGRFFFLSQHVWLKAWEVIGPRKNYRSITKFTRLEPC